MTSHIDYDRAFARFKVLHSVHRHVDLLKVECPDYRVVAQSPFLIYPNGNVYAEPVVEPSLTVYWRITHETFLLEEELAMLALHSLHDTLERARLLAINVRCKNFFPWLTRIHKEADRMTVRRLKQQHLLN